jgi:hypothetical protein
MFDRNKPENPDKKKMAALCGLEIFFDWQRVDIHKAYQEGYVDEIKSFLISLLQDLQKYIKYRKEYKNELQEWLRALSLTYFTQEDIQNIESFLEQTQKEFKQENATFDNNTKNDYIQNIFETTPHILSYTGQKIDEEKRALLMMSLYNSFIHSKEKTPKQRRLRYNRLFLRQQLENKKIYYKQNKFTAARKGNKDLLELLVPPRKK